MPADFFPEPPPAEDDVYHVWSMCYGKGLTRRVHDNFVFRDMHDGPMPLDYNLWVLRNAHRTVLVDTGFSPRASAERGRPIDFDPVEGLKRIGVDPDAIALQTIGPRAVTLIDIDRDSGSFQAMR